MERKNQSRRPIGELMLCKEYAKRMLFCYVLIITVTIFHIVGCMNGIFVYASDVSDVDDNSTFITDIYDDIELCSISSSITNVAKTIESETAKKVETTEIYNTAKENISSISTDMNKNITDIIEESEEIETETEEYNDDYDNSYEYEYEEEYTYEYEESNDDLYEEPYIENSGVSYFEATYYGVYSFDGVTPTGMGTHGASGNALINGGSIAINNDQRIALGLSYGQYVYIESASCPSINGSYRIDDCGCPWGVVDIFYWAYTTDYMPYDFLSQGRVFDLVMYY